MFRTVSLSFIRSFART